MTEDPVVMKIEFLTARASRLGYQLVQTGASWALLDAEDGKPIRTALSLSGVERWLNQ